VSNTVIDPLRSEQGDAAARLLARAFSYVISLLLLVTLSANPQDRQPASVCRLETKYDSGADTTTVKCDLIESVEFPTRLTVQANASFRGKGEGRGKEERGEKEPNEATKFWLFLSSNRGRATRRTQPLFREATTLYLVMDSARLEIPVEDYRNDFYELIRSFSESARAEIGSEDLRKLLNAKSLKGEWGGIEFKFSEAALASLKNFISRQVFAGVIR